VTARVYLALGANVGDREANLRMALRLLARACRITAVSSLYRSEAMVLEGSPPGPDYLNAVCEAETDLGPAALLRFVKEIEHEIGRRPSPRWSTRPIDIDIILYGDETVDTPDLRIPHSSMHERNFDLVPLAELAPGAAHPLAGRTAGELAEDVDLGGLEHVRGPEWASDLVAAPRDGADGAR
jgi:2-amino-4-hydroxy-6-hydroxymethyldihydropteridine diphosphokinase